MFLLRGLLTEALAGFWLLSRADSRIESCPVKPASLGLSLAPSFISCLGKVIFYGKGEFVLTSPEPVA